MLAPATRLVAQKILEDTGDVPNISITMEELDEAMKQEPPTPVPVMTERCLEELGMTFSCPYLWDIMVNDRGGLDVYSRYDGANAWDMAVLYITPYIMEEEGGLQDMKKELEDQGYAVEETLIQGNPALEGYTMVQDDNGNLYYQRHVVVQHGRDCIYFYFVIYEDYMEEADVLFQQIIDSIAFDG